MQALTQLVAPLGALVGALVILERFTAAARLRSWLTTAVTLLDKLPQDSPARSTLLAHIQRQVQRLIILETPGTTFRKSTLAGGVALMLASALLGLGALGASRQPDSTPEVRWLYAEAIVGIGVGVAVLMIEYGRTIKARKAAETASHQLP